MSVNTPPQVQNDDQTVVVPTATKTALEFQAAILNSFNSFLENSSKQQKEQADMGDRLAKKQEHDTDKMYQQQKRERRRKRRSKGFTGFFKSTGSIVRDVGKLTIGGGAGAIKAVGSSFTCSKKGIGFDSKKMNHKFDKLNKSEKQLGNKVLANPEFAKDLKILTYIGAALMIITAFIVNPAIGLLLVAVVIAAQTGLLDKMTSGLQSVAGNKWGDVISMAIMIGVAVATAGAALGFEGPAFTKALVDLIGLKGEAAMVFTICFEVVMVVASMGAVGYAGAGEVAEAESSEAEEQASSFAEKVGAMLAKAPIELPPLEDLITLMGRMMVLMQTSQGVMQILAGGNQIEMGIMTRKIGDLQYKISLIKADMDQNSQTLQLTQSNASNVIKNYEQEIQSFRSVSNSLAQAAAGLAS